MWVGMQLSAQSSFQQLNVDNSFQKHSKLDITFLKSFPILQYFFDLFQILWLGL